MSTKINLKNLPEGYQTIITNGTHTIIGDEPIKSKGTDLGLAPTELLLASLGMCKVATVRYIARKRGWHIKEIQAALSQDVKRGNNMSLSTSVKVKIHIEGDLSEVQRKELLDQADNCYIHRMIEGDWAIEKAVSNNEAQISELA